ncbi:MAG: F0F1 ATP synthase subunit epsilon [Nitrospinota bacterium]
MEEGKIRLEVVTPERLLFREEVDEVTAPGAGGEFGVLPGHTPFLCRLDVGALSYRKGDRLHFVSVVGGFAEMGPNYVTVLAERAERAEEIDVGRAREARKRAERHLARQTEGSVDFDRAAAALRRAMSRLRVATLAGEGREEEG